MTVVIIYYLIFHTNFENKKNIYVGESDNWSASYTVDITESTNNKNNKLQYSNKIKSSLKLYFKKYQESPDKIKVIEYDLKSSARNLNGEINFLSNNKAGKVEITSANENLKYESDDEEIMLTIKYMGIKEEINLKRDLHK
jgi:hypothetical protein